MTGTRGDDGQVQFDRPLRGKDHQVESAIGYNEAGEPQRLRFNLRCQLCGRNVPAKDEKLQSIFHQLAEHGVSRIELEALGRRLSGRSC